MDPIRRSSKSRNLYAYTVGDPINLVDSSGHGYRPHPENGRVKDGESTDFLDAAAFVYVPQAGQTWKVGPIGSPMDRFAGTVSAISTL